jgi:PAS domain S-box-containing protein
VYAEEERCKPIFEHANGVIVFEALFEGSRDAAFISDSQSRFAAVNRASVELTGYAREELLRMSVPDLCAERDLTARRQFHDRILAGEEIAREVAIRRKDGTSVCAELSSRRIVIAGTTYVHTTARDITDRKLAEKALHESEERYRGLFENAREAFVLVGLDGNIACVNRFVEEYGFKREELVGRKLFDFVAEGDAARAVADFTTLLGGTLVKGEMEVVAPKGVFSVEYRDNPIKRGDQIVGVQVILTDITERKKAEQQLLDYQNKLRRLAAELTLAEERERRRIAVGVHDQIAQRLALAKLTLQSLGVSSSEARTSSTVEAVCKDIDRVIEDAHSLTFELSNPVLYEVGLEGAVESWLAREVRDRHGIEYTFKADERPVDLDKEKRVAVFHVVRELLTNVIKHAKARHVDVRVERIAKTVRITVQDDGVGFRPSAVGPSGSKSGGFGLFNVREKLDYLGGSLKIESAPGEGTCIVIVVPLGHSRDLGKGEHRHEDLDRG